MNTVLLFIPLLLSSQETDFHIAVNVDLVVLTATVHDRKGQLAPQLGVQDFQVFEDGTRQTIRVFRHEDVPVTVGLVVDHSGSMRNKLPGVIAAGRAFASSSNPDDHMFVVNFNEQVTVGADRFTDGPNELAAAIMNRPAAGQTALYDAIFAALERLPKAGPEKKALLVVSDGSDNASKHSLAEVLDKLSKSNAIVYSIGIFDLNDADSNRGVLRQLARVTGGEAFFPQHYSDVTGVCQQIAREIRTQYTLGYVSTNASRTGSRNVMVTAGRNLTVRTRTSYTAGGK